MSQQQTGLQKDKIQIRDADLKHYFLTPSLLRHARSALYDLTGELTRTYFEQIEMASEEGFRTLLLGEMAEMQDVAVNKCHQKQTSPPRLDGTTAILTLRHFPGKVNNEDPNQFFDAIYVFGVATRTDGERVHRFLEKHRLWHYQLVYSTADASTTEEWRCYRRIWTAIPGHYDDGGICQLADWVKVKQVWNFLKQARMAHHRRILIIDADKWLRQRPATTVEWGHFEKAVQELPEKWQMWYLGGLVDTNQSSGFFYANGAVREGWAVALQESFMSNISAGLDQPEPFFAALQRALMTLASPWDEVFRQEQRRLGDMAIVSSPLLL